MKSEFSVEEKELLYVLAEFYKDGTFGKLIKRLKETDNTLLEIHDLDWPINHAYNVVYRFMEYKLHKEKFVSNLIGVRYSELRSWQGCGNKTMDQIESTLEKYGYVFVPEGDDKVLMNAREV